MKKIMALSLAVALSATVGCRNTVVNSDSLLATNQDVLFGEINGVDAWVFKKNIHSGSTSYTNKVLQTLYSEGFKAAFGIPDATVMSFATNEAMAIYREKVSYDSAFESFWRLAHQTVEAGSRCIVLFEGSHIIGNRESEQGIETNKTLTNWFYDMHQLEGDREYLGYKYKFVIADISGLIEDDRGKYIADYVHLTEEGTMEAGKAIKAALATCPDGRWNFYDPVTKYTYADGESASVEPWHIRGIK